MRVLYLTHNGLTEPLGQSQVLPYLRGAAKRGAKIDVVSFEPASASDAEIDRVMGQARDASLGWQYIRRSAKHDLATKIAEAGKALALAASVAVRARPKIVHTRSYVFGPVIEAIASAVPGGRMLFDCRGMLADEYVDIGYWREGEPRVRAVRSFEAHAFRRAEGLVFLTHRVRRLLEAQGRLSTRAAIDVIPCCVDMAKFRPSEAERAAVRAELSAGDRPVVVYSGSLGGWYLVREMARFVGALRRRVGPLVWLILSRSPLDEIRRFAELEGVPPEEIVCRSVSPHDMPRMLAAGDLGLSFIKPCFSKLGSSPTKVAEYLGVGMPVVVNGGIGDQDTLGTDEDACVLLSSFAADAVAAGAAAAHRLIQRKWKARIEAPVKLARREFDVEEVGVARYSRLYERLAS